MFDLLFKTPERSMLVHGSVKRPKEPDLSRHLKLWTDKRILSNIQNLLHGGFGVMGCRFWKLDKTLFFAVAVLSHPSVKQSTSISLESRTFFTTFQTSEPLRAVSIKWTNEKSEYDSTILPGFWITDFF